MYKKGQSGNPNGRKKGVPNKQTAEIREAYQRLTEANLENMTHWLQSIAADDPAKAMDMMLKLSEFIIPKLASTIETSHCQPPQPARFTINGNTLLHFTATPHCRLMANRRSAQCRSWHFACGHIQTCRHSPKKWLRNFDRTQPGLSSPGLP